MDVGMYIIFVNVASLLYFSFRDGIRGGVITTAISVLYYFYIVITRNFTGQQYESGIRTALMLGGTYFIIAVIIGWLKQRIDFLIVKEADARRRLETIMQQLPVGILITDNQGRITQRNKRLDTILGARLAIGSQVDTNILMKKSQNKGTFHLPKSLTGKKTILSNEYEHHRSDGKRVYLEVSSTPIFNAKRKAIATATIINDITRQKELEQQKDNFLGMASHELKTPVTSIKAYAQVLQSQFRRKGNLEAAEKLKRLDIQVNKLTNLIGDLLDITKIHSGRLDYHTDTFDFNQLVEEVVEELRLTADKHTIETKLDSPKRITADRERIGQALTNLITNAVKYSPRADKIIITTKVDNSKIVLSVTDFGIGIPKEKQKKVFEQFFRVSGAHQNTFPGLGLGLYITAQIIKREKGRIWAESREGKGSTFYFSLPIRKTKS